MQPIVLTRVVAWLGTVAVGWSLNLRWGDDPNLPAGPPSHLERPIVGAMLLAMVAAIALSTAARGWVARGLALAGGAGAVAISLWARSRGPDTALGGAGWLWMMLGAAAVLAAAAGRAALKAPPARTKKPAKRR